jgi:hypothetical protein
LKGFVKIYATILDSSVWGESKDVKILWVTMLAMGGEHGLVEASLGGLARRAGLTREECEVALAVLSAPDPDDSSGVNEGRRISKVERGWRITNHRIYRDFRTDKQIGTAERVQKHRAKNRSVTSVTGNDVTVSNASSHSVRPEEEADSEEDLDPEAEEDPRASARPTTPSEVEHQATEPKLTTCPLDLPAKAETLGIVRDFVEAYRVEPEQIRDAVREFTAHWTIGGGAGRREGNWPRKLRADLKWKCTTPGKLKSLGELGHAEVTRETRQQSASDNSAMNLMREAEALASRAAAAPARRAPAPAPVRATPAGALITDLSKALGGRA